jgi:hypothetical protein
MIISDNGKRIEIQWEESDTEEVKEIVALQIQLARIIVMLSQRSSKEGK